MKKHYPKMLFSAFILIFFINLTATNTMELGMHLIGNVDEAYAYSVAVLDYNADGLPDLAILSRRTRETEDIHPQSPLRGKIDIHFGRPDGLPSATPDLTIWRHTITDSMMLFNQLIAADMNGNGLKDLVVIGSPYYYYPVPPFYEHLLGYHIFYSGTLVGTNPGFTGYVKHEGLHTPYVPPVNILGDINGDGCDALGFIETRPIQPVLNSTADVIAHIIYGDPVQPYVKKLAGYQHNVSSVAKGEIRGIGDVNNDGYDDIGIIMRDLTQGYDPYNWRYIHGVIFGGSEPDSTIHSIYVPEDLNYSGNYEIAPIGDFNGDGIADFLGYKRYGGVWFGNETLDLNTPDLNLDRAFFNERTVCFGDFNGNGYSDFFVTDRFQPTMPPISSGRAVLYLGGPNPNAVADLAFEANEYIIVSSRYYFGEIALAADMNNDGYDDLIIVARGRMDDTPGLVFIFLGNPDLTDTTVSITDNVIEVNSVFFDVYPNPSKNFLNFEFKNLEEYQDVSIDIYNIKGQKIKQVLLDPSDLKNGMKSTLMYDLPSAIYLCRLKSKGEILKTKKITVIK